MRLPIYVKVPAFDLDKHRTDVTAVILDFADYTVRAPRKSLVSRHGLMGPVGKILALARRGQKDRGFLKGYVVRVHEMQSSGPALLETTAMQSLESGIDRMVTMLDATPAKFQDKLVDRIDYGLYFELRKRQAEQYEALRQKWIEFLRKKYRDEAGVSEAWGEGIEFATLRTPKRTPQEKDKIPRAKLNDAALFYSTLGSSTAELESEGDEDQ